MRCSLIIIVLFACGVLIIAEDARAQRRTSRPTREEIERQRRLEKLRAERERKLEAERRAERARWSRYLSSWRKQLEDEDPKVVARALFHVGVGYEGLERWPQAVESYEKLIEEHPTSLWRGEAQVRLFDVQFYYQAEPFAAIERLNHGIGWLDSVSIERTELTSEMDTMLKQLASHKKEDETGPPFDQPEPRPTWIIACDIFQRAILVEFLRGEYEAAMEWYQQMSLRRYPGRVGRSPLDQLIQRAHFQARFRQPLAPKSIWEGDATAALMLHSAVALSSSYAHQREGAQELAEDVIAKRECEPSDLQLSYAHLLRSKLVLVDPKQERKHRRAVTGLETARKLAPEAEWAAETIMMTAAAAIHVDNDVESAIERYRQVMAEFPDSKEAKSSAYTIGKIYQQRERYAEAEQAFEKYMELYPDKHSVERANARLREIRRKLPRREQSHVE